MTNPLRELEGAGQAVWLDYLHRKILEDGELKRLIDEDGIKGLTSNPSIFEKAIGEGDAYDDRVQAALKTRPTARRWRLYERIAIADIQAAADIFRPTYDRLGGRDGYVSLEVSPKLANDTDGTIAEARRLWQAVDRPNLMIKVPGTRAGVAGHPPADRRGDQRQRHPAVRRRRLSATSPRPHGRPGGAARPRAATSRRSTASPASSSAASTPRSTRRSTRAWPRARRRPRRCA